MSQEGGHLTPPSLNGRILDGLGSLSLLQHFEAVTQNTDILKCLTPATQNVVHSSGAMALTGSLQVLGPNPDLLSQNMNFTRSLVHIQVGVTELTSTISY